MGRYQVKFKCRHCRHCCTDVVCLPTPWDVLRIALNMGENPYAFLEFLTPDEITGVNKNDSTWLRVQGKKYIMALKRTPGKGCHFLERKTGFCRAYEHRPILCRLYPFRLQETQDGKLAGFTLHKNVGCPKERDAVHDTEPLYALYLKDRMHHEDYDKMVEAFNKQEMEHQEPSDFLKLFVEVVEEK